MKLQIKTRPEWVAAALLAALWLVCAWRAATQSIVHDEALTYQFYLAGPSSELFNHFDANHHFLSTLLMRVSTTLFGFSPIAMRLPALAGAALFFAALFRFCRWAFGSGWLLPMAVAAVSLNPFILDFMVAARGYGLALALWMWALALVAPQLDVPQLDVPQLDVPQPGVAAPDRKPVAIAGACAALSVAANLVFVLPVAMLIGIVIWFSARKQRTLVNAPAKKRARGDPRRRSAMWLDFLLPAVAIAIAFLLLAPLEHAAGEHFYAGAASISESLRSLAAVSIDHSGPDAYQRLAAHLVDPVAFVLGPSILIFSAIAGWRLRNLPLILTAIPAAGSAVLLLALHFLLDAPYPADRTGIYFIPALTLAIVAFGNLPMLALRAAAFAIAILTIVCFAIQFDPRMFAVWQYDADTNRIAAQLSQIVAENAQSRPMTIANSWQLEPALNFYRETLHYDRLPPFTRRPIAPGSDVYVLTLQDRERVEELGLTIVYTGSVSKTVIATSAGPPASH